MSYTPTEWKSGDTITSTKLNKMEQGIAAGGSGGGVLVVGIDATTGALDKTWQEIYDADFAVVVMESDGNKLMAYVYGLQPGDNKMGTDYTVMLMMADNSQFAVITATAESASDYPQIQD